MLALWMTKCDLFQVVLLIKNIEAHASMVVNMNQQTSDIRLVMDKNLGKVWVSLESNSESEFLTVTVWFSDRPSHFGVRSPWRPVKIEIRIPEG